MFGLFQQDKTSDKGTTQSAAFLIQGVKSDPSVPSQLKLLVNKKTPNLKQKLDELKESLNIALWSYTRTKKSEVLSELLQLPGQLSVTQFRKKLPPLKEYEFTKSEDKDFITLTVKGANLECTINCLIRNRFCEESAIPKELEQFIPDLTRVMRFNDL